MSIISLHFNVKSQISLNEILEQFDLLHDYEKMELIEMIFEKINSQVVKRETVENLGNNSLPVL